jgi:hypothetical protein
MSAGTNMINTTSLEEALGAWTLIYWTCRISGYKDDHDIGYKMPAKAKKTINLNVIYLRKQEIILYGTCEESGSKRCQLLGLWKVS